MPNALFLLLTAPRHGVAAVVLLVLALAAAGCVPPEATPGEAAADRAAIESLLQAQVEAWNSGDIPRFMEGYWRSDSLRFASGNAIQQGYDNTLARYHRSYPDRQTMGTLAFTLFEVSILSPGTATVFGRFHLTRDAAIGDAEGLFTLIFRKFPEGWRIVSDHTSS
jgi:ketosteroid isomerase-like protein